KELKAFGRVQLQPGEAADVTFSVPVDMLCFTGYDGQRIVEAGQFELQVGASSADISLRKTIEVAGESVGETRRLGRDWRMFSRVVSEAAG
ncbi:MAG: fibronectin type III-like domain-contianing protein, partial [Propionivibrio sp.]|nr:fibronectin type III-like domain-contianing protein [Propionivibrio sp.]